jgi:hypothetical protein
MAYDKIDISNEAGSIKIVKLPTAQNSPQYHKISGIKSIVPVLQVGVKSTQSDGSYTNTYPYEDKVQVTITFTDENGSSPIKFDLQDVNNQPSWTADKAGLDQAVADINGWV